MGRLTGDAKAKAAAEGARTVPPREHGGNCDIKDLSRGSKIYLPGLRAGRRPVDGRPALQPGRRRDHLLRRHRDGRLGAHQGRASSRAAWRSTASRIRSSSPARSRRTTSDYLIFEGISVDEAGQAALPRRARRLPPGLPERDRVPEEVRLLRRAGLLDPRHGAGAGPHQRRGRHPQRLRHAVAADGDLRLRHHAERRRPDQGVTPDVDLAKVL